MRASGFFGSSLTRNRRLPYWLTELVMLVREFSGNSPRSLPVGPRSHECGNKEPKK